MYYLATRYIGKIITIHASFDDADSHKKFRVCCFFLRLLFFTYFLMWTGLGYRLYAQGLYDWQLFLSQIVVKSCFTIMKIQLFIFLSLFEVELTLKTSVNLSGDVVIHGVDLFDREFIRLKIGKSKNRSAGTFM